MLSLIDEAGHNKDEHRKVRHRGNYLLVATEERAGSSEPRNNLIGMQYPERAEDTKKAQTLPNYRRQEGYDCRHVRPSGRVRKFPHRIGTYVEARRKIGEDNKSEDHIEPFDPSRAGYERRTDDEQDREGIENEKPVAKPLRDTTFTEIKAAQLVPKGNVVSLRFGRRR